MSKLYCLLPVLAAFALSSNALGSAREPARFVASGESQLDNQGRKLYVVQLAGEGALARSQRPIPARETLRRRLQRDGVRIASQAAVLTNEQLALVRDIGPAAELVYQYQYTFNGAAIRMTPREAQILRRHPSVLAIWEDSVRKVATNESPTFLNLFDDETGLTGALDLKGENVVIAVIDSGITPEHPSFSDRERPRSPRLCETSFGESFLGLWLCRRYEKAEPELSYEPLPGWNGSCQEGEDFLATDCNNKLVGARYFVAGALANQQVADNEILSARDADGHGTHIASTAAGNRVTAKINGANVARIQGIAPRARIAAYKACWLRPGAIRASCNASDLAQAIDQAVADGVDIISYSVGNDDGSINSPDALALLAASKAGIFSAVAAGNAGPGLGTISSPASAPWVTTVAASSRDGGVFDEALEILEPAANAGRILALEADFTQPLADSGTIEETLVRVDDGSTDVANLGETGAIDDACQAIENNAAVSGKIAYIRRTGCTFSTKIRNAEDAGAIAVVVFSNTGAPVTMSSDDNTAIEIPAVMIGQADGDLLLDRLLEEELVRLRLANGLFLEQADTGNRVADFSSRGPVSESPDILKPDLTAPGINILAATSSTQANGPKGLEFAYLSGTSMATPHVAGVAALLREANPDWSPAALRSALMSSAYTEGVTRGEGEPADAFDRGAGHLNPNGANTPGLVFDASDLDYDAFGCGAAAFSSVARCDELSSAGISFAAADFNQASLSLGKLTDRRTVTRTVTNLGPADSWVAETLTPPGFQIDVNPSTLTLGTGQSASYAVTIEQAASQLDAWYFGELNWVGESSRVSTPIALKAASIDAPERISEAGGAGSRSFDVKFGYTGPYQAGVHGLQAAVVTNDFVANDPDKNFDDEGCSDEGTVCFEITVRPGTLYYRLALFDSLTDGDDDLDLFVYFCANGLDGGFCPEVAVSGEATSNEEINLVTPQAGSYLVLVHGFDTDEVAGGPGSNFSLLTWELFGTDANGDIVADPAGNLTVDAPVSAQSGTSANLTLNWSDLDPGNRYLGLISHQTPGGTVALTSVEVSN